MASSSGSVSVGNSSSGGDITSHPCNRRQGLPNGEGEELMVGFGDRSNLRTGRGEVVGDDGSGDSVKSSSSMTGVSPVKNSRHR